MSAVSPTPWLTNVERDETCNRISYSVTFLTKVVNVLLLLSSSLKGEVLLRGSLSVLELLVLRGLS